MAAQPAAILHLSESIEADALVEYFTSVRGAPVQVRTTTTSACEVWEIVCDGTLSEVLLQFEGEEVIIKMWPGYPHDYLFAVATRFIVERGGRSRPGWGSPERLAELLERGGHSWAEESSLQRRRGLFRRAAVVALATAAILIAWFIGT